MMSPESRPDPDASPVRHFPWINLLLTFVLAGVGLWFLSTRVPLAELATTLAAASLPWVALGLAIMLLTLLLKAWRWQLMFTPEAPAVSFSTAFWASSLGQYVNLIVPFLRLGEVARIYVLNQEADIRAARTIGTLVLEKVLDLIFFGLTILLVVPFTVLPDYLDQSMVGLIAVPALLLLVLYVLAYRTEWAISILEAAARPLPDRLEQWLLRVAVSGLEGLSALRDSRLILMLLLLSLVIATFGILLPYVLFPALGLELGILQAALIHIVVSIAVAPPSTPVKIGVFNGAAALMLWQAGVRDETSIISYSILFYLVVIAPQIVLGIIAAGRSNWRWSAGRPADLATDAQHGA